MYYELSIRNEIHFNFNSAKFTYMSLRISVKLGSVDVLWALCKMSTSWLQSTWLLHQMSLQGSAQLQRGPENAPTLHYCLVSEDHQFLKHKSRKFRFLQNWLLCLLHGSGCTLEDITLWIIVTTLLVSGWWHWNVVDVVSSYWVLV